MTDSSTNPTPPDPPPNSEPLNLLKTDLAKVTHAQITALRLAPTHHIVYMAIAFLVAVTVFSLGGGLIASGYALYALLTLVCGLVVLALAMVLVFLLKPPQEESAEKVVEKLVERPVESQWSRITVKSPIPSSVQLSLRKDLQSIWNKAKAEYRARLEARPTPPDSINPKKNVRANVFVPATREALLTEDGEVCALYIPKHLQINMRNDEEKAIRFRLNQGTTGRVFTQEQVIGARLKPNSVDWEWLHFENGGVEVWRDKFILTSKQIEQIDKNLLWVISFPLMLAFEGESHTIGVLNVDGLGEMLTEEEMRIIYENLKSEVDVFAEKFGQLDKRRIAIMVEDIESVAPV